MNDRITNPSEIIVNCINILRNEEGSSVEILCENPDGEPTNVVVVSDDWTDWEPRRFGGNTLLDALRAAVAARTEAKNKL